MIEDSFMHKGLRRKLVDQVQSKGIKDQRILDAMLKIPRHAFMDSSFLKFAYQDQAFPISSGQTISQPFTVAFQTELLDVQFQQKVLEIGTGSGYQSAILAEMGARVYTIERIRKLYQNAQLIHRELGYPIKFFLGDGYQGLPPFSPFDRILLTAAASVIPDVLKQQLAVGGILVAPIGQRDFQVMIKCVRTGPDTYKISEHGNFAFVPMREGLD
jgi:protein-L-isoaspartate(D-aspartate) O-methyltransferase